MQGAEEEKSGGLGKPHTGLATCKYIEDVGRGGSNRAASTLIGIRRGGFSQALLTNLIMVGARMGATMGLTEIRGLNPVRTLSSVFFHKWNYSLHLRTSLHNEGEGNGNPLQCSCLENPMDREAWWATVHRVTKNRTRLK